jgi:hypothetical protein
LAIFVFNGPINGLDRRLQVDKPYAGVVRLFTLERRRDDLCKGASSLPPSVQAPFSGVRRVVRS